MKINAFAAAKKRAPLAPWSFETKELRCQECVVRVLACGICHSDVHMIDNDWMMSQYPLVPGHEIVGEVMEVGSGVSHIKAGDRVGIGWQKSACMHCDDCLHGNENLCDHNVPTIVGNHGGFADHVVTDSRFVFKIPDGLETPSVGPLLCGGITVFSALHYAGMTSGQRVGIIGVGGLGHMAVQFASKMGNHVTAFTTSSDKAEFAAILGAHDAVVVTGNTFSHAPAKKLDILLSTIPAPLDLDNYINLLNSDGTLCYVGIGEASANVPLLPLLQKRRRVMASPIGGRGMIRHMLDVADAHGVAPIVELFPFDKVNEAIDKVRNNTIRYRAVLMN
mgnify:FL=1